MAGERQPGGRPPAPGGLALVQAFLNTHYDLAGGGREVLDSPGALAAWLGDRGLLAGGPAPGRDDLERALRLREGLRALTRANNDGHPDAAAEAVLEETGLVEVRLGPAGPRFRPDPAGGVAGAIGLLLAVTARAMLDGTWPRLKACPGRHCGWAFYDGSRNLAGRWCSMSVCGGRAKARAHYRRQTGREA